MIYPKTIPRRYFFSSRVIPEHYKFVHLDKPDESGEDLPRFSMHKRMYSTFIQAPHRTTAVKTGDDRI